MNVLFAPDYREGVGYQEFLARELRLQGVGVEFLSHYRRGLPLTRGAGDFDCDILHLHWPEAYFPGKRRFAGMRKLRYFLDLKLATRKRKLFLTAHNLLPHNRHSEWGVFSAMKATVRRSAGVFVHSEFAREEMARTFGINKDKCWLIPFGDHTVEWDSPMERLEARKRMGLNPTSKICFIFGTVSPYKGTDEVIKYWKQYSPDTQLIVAGPILDDEFASRLRTLAEGVTNVELRISKEWLPEDDLRIWLSAVDCTVFNYRDIFTSGAAALARSMGVPVLIPTRLKAADLHEPHPLVFRYESLATNFEQQLQAACKQEPSFEAAAEWRNKTSWQEVARITKTAYESAMPIENKTSVK